MSTHFDPNKKAKFSYLTKRSMIKKAIRISCQGRKTITKPGDPITMHWWVAADDPPSTNIAGLSHSHQRPVFIRIISPAIRIIFAWLKETHNTPLTQTYDALMSPVQTQQAYNSLERPTTKCEDRCTQLSNTHPSNIVICYL